MPLYIYIYIHRWCGAAVVTVEWRLIFWLIEYLRIELTNYGIKIEINKTKT
jgi:hypothetical protein